MTETQISDREDNENLKRNLDFYETENQKLKETVSLATAICQSTFYNEL